MLLYLLQQNPCQGTIGRYVDGFEDMDIDEITANTTEKTNGRGRNRFWHKVTSS